VRPRKVVARMVKTKTPQSSSCLHITFLSSVLWSMLVSRKFLSIKKFISSSIGG
jgi:hypothetical protein